MKYFKIFRDKDGKLHQELDNEAIGKEAFRIFETFGFPVEMYMEELDKKDMKRIAFQEFIQYTEEHPEEFKELEQKYKSLSDEEQTNYSNSAKKVIGI